MAVAAYWAAVESRAKDKITLRQGARVVVKNWSDGLPSCSRSGRQTMDD
jgi:hypothetical protein